MQRRHMMGLGVAVSGLGLAGMAPGRRTVPCLTDFGLHTIGLSRSFVVAGICLLATGLTLSRVLRAL
jgi:hypothetical protein